MRHKMRHKPECFRCVTCSVLTFEFDTPHLKFLVAINIPCSIVWQHKPTVHNHSAFLAAMGNKVVKQHFETAQKTGVLQITQQRLQEFPPHLRDFPNALRTLDLSENRFATLPDAVAHFTLLRHLNVNSNRLTELPDALAALVKLETLSAINNLIARVPRGLAQLVNLKKVSRTWDRRNIEST